MKTHASWKFPIYVNPARKKSWYIWAILIFILLLIYSILTANFLFGLIIIIIAILMFIYHQKEVEEVDFAIQANGLKLNDQFYDFGQFKKFWLVYQPPAIKNLYFQFNSPLKPTLVIPLQNENPVEVRKILKDYLTEDLDKENESTSEALNRVLKIQ